MSSEQIGLKGGGPEAAGSETTTLAAPGAGAAPAAAAGDAGSDASSAEEAEIGPTQTGIGTTQIDSEHISFDFFVNIEISAVTEANIIAVMAKSLETDEGQIEDVKLTGAGTQKRALTRISGKVHCDEWEMKILTDKFNRLIPDRILSQNIMDVMGLEDRPRVSRFFSRASTVGSGAGLIGTGLQQSGTSAAGSAGGSTDASSGASKKSEDGRSDSFRKPHNLESGSGLKANTSEVRQPTDDGDDPAAPSSKGGCCLVM